jgi:hypothetical protein
MAAPTKFNASAIPAGRETIADMIVSAFATADYGALQQIAALANAIAESNLDPNAASAPPDRSFGLFQCNTGGGLGTGFTQAQLCDPKTNIDIIIKEANRHSDFKDAKTLQEAVSAFVRKIERPADPNGETQTRFAIAQKLMPA